MKRTKKHIIGVCGLILVAALTAVAAFLPAPKASAIEPTSASDDTTVQVLVLQRSDSVRITSPADGTETDQPTIRIDYAYTTANKVTHWLVNKSTGETFYLTDMDYYPSNPDGTHSITLDLNKYGGYGKYVIYVMINDEEVTQDAVSFEYVAHIPVPPTPDTPDTGDLEVPETNLIISRLDIIVSGIVVFMLVALIAVHIMRRSTRK